MADQNTAIVDIHYVKKITTWSAPTAKKNADGKLFPKPLKRKARNQPYQWRRAEVDAWAAQGQTMDQFTPRQEVFIRQLVLRSHYIPNTSPRRCQGWRMCGIHQQPSQRLFGPSRGQSP